MLRILSITLLFVFAPFWGGHTNSVAWSNVEVLHGLDVSHHQKRIAWDSVAAKDPVDFVFVKATEGGDFVDSLFCQNWEDLRRLGIRRGAYHFFRAYGCGETQAYNFLAQVNMEPGDIAPVLDIEVLDNIDPEIMAHEALVWLQTVQKCLGVRPIIYTNQHFYERYLAACFEDYPLWIARYSTEKPDLAAGKNWDIWQYSNQGCIEGIPQKVDLNVFMGSHAMLDRLCWYPAMASATNAGKTAQP